jgi:hypothetical protein
MNLFPKQQTTIGYNTIAEGIADKETVGPVPPLLFVGSSTLVAIVLL